MCSGQQQSGQLFKRVLLHPRYLKTFENHNIGEMKIDFQNVFYLEMSFLETKTLSTDSLSDCAVSCDLSRDKCNSFHYDEDTCHHFLVII